MDTEIMKRVKQAVDNLHRLFNDPQPGMYSWSQMVVTNTQVICDWWSGKLAETPTKGA